MGRRWLVPVVVLVIATLVVGVLGGWLWHQLTPLPGYTVHADGGATTSERGLTEFILADVVFSAIGLVCGIGLGVIAWRGFGRSVGWPAVPIAAAAAVAGGVVCWQVGEFLDPADFASRLAGAGVGDVVRIDLHLRSVVALAVWALGACGALLVATAVLRDPDDGYPVGLPWTRAGSTGDGGEPAVGDGEQIGGGQAQL